MRLYPEVFIFLAIIGICFGFCNVCFAAGLEDVVFRPLDLGEITAQGWLKHQLQIQADALSGNLDLFWPDIQKSAWFDGDAEGWERAPYWLDGVIPLAYTLDDPNLKEKVTRYINIIVERQHDDGWLGPKNDNLKEFDLWSHFLAWKMLAQYQKATGNVKVKEAIVKDIRRIDQHIDKAPLKSWAWSRWFEALVAIYQLYEETQEDWFLKVANKLRSQGANWPDFWAKTPITKPTPDGKWNLWGHVVNNAMALKAGPLCWRMTGEDADRMAVYDMMEKLDRYHGMVTGVFSGDECLAGKNPTQGTELCSVVEYMYSLEVLLSLLGDPAFGDRLEKICFNALPATFSPDMWSHQYDQQVNQVECSIKKRNWTTNGPQSNIYGLEPNYGCCTSNLSQGWPKFAAHLWMRKDDGLAAVAYAPCLVKTQIGAAIVKLRVKTEYPFRDRIDFTVAVDKPSKFSVYLRIPAWSKEAFVVVDGKKAKASAGTFFRIERKWNKKTKLRLVLPAKPQIVRGYNNAAAILRGPLLFGLKIGEKWTAVNKDKKYREPPHGDWEVYPTSPWNYALDVSEKTVEKDVVFSHKTLGKMVFSPKDAPVVAKVKAVRLPEWKMVKGSAGPTPKSPVKVEGEFEQVTLIPYGCTNLRIAEFPTLK
ncbi:MAG: beta-L-arabinofuranosidase domain-containing protein [Planctomycetota bacterium]|jgi:DUF1680 family protein